MNRTQIDYARTNKKADDFEREWVKTQLNRPEVAELIQIGCEYEESFKKQAKSLIFRYHDNYLDIQNELTTLMIGEPGLDMEDSTPELEGTM